MSAERQAKLKTIWSRCRCMPPALAVLFTEGERAALSAIAFECSLRPDCRLSVGEIGRMAGVSPRTVRRALRLWRDMQLNLFSVHDRTCWGDTNILRISSRQWSIWLAQGRWNGPADFQKGSSVEGEGVGQSLEGSGAPTGLGHSFVGSGNWRQKATR
jgi:hypothetical protein